VGALSSPSLSDWGLPFGADGSGGAPPVAIVLTHGVLTRGVSSLARWPRPLGHSVVLLGGPLGHSNLHS